eukprot:SM000021S06485  [mRNA]  locus=s21:650911:657617:+ [translate_table: standard]
MGNPLSKPAETVGRAIIDSADKLNGTASWAAARVGESAEAAKATMAQMKVAANAISRAATHAEVAADSAQLGPKLSTTLDQASSIPGALQDSVNQITPQAASTPETVQKCVQILTPTAQSALDSLSFTSKAVGQNIPALMQSCPVAIVAGAAALASPAQNLKRIAVNSTELVATKEASLVFRAAEGTSKRAGGFLRGWKHDQHGVFIPATEDAYLMCCDDFTKELQERHLARTPRHAIEKVKAIRESGVLLKGMEVVYHRDVMSFTCDKDIIERPEGMGLFIMCGSTDLHGQPYIKLKGVICDMDNSGAPMGKTLGLGVPYVGQGRCCCMLPDGPLDQGREREKKHDEVVAHLLLASRAPLDPQQLGESREVSDGEAQSGGGLHEPARSVSVEVRAAGGASLGQPRHSGDGARVWEKRGRARLAMARLAGPSATRGSCWGDVAAVGGQCGLVLRDGAPGRLYGRGGAAAAAARGGVCPARRAPPVRHRHSRVYVSWTPPPRAGAPPRPGGARR